MSYFNESQVAQLLRPINARRVSQRSGMSHLEAYDVRAHLNRIFGFCRWSADLVDLAPLFETLTDERVSVGYRATVKLTVCAPDGTVLATYTEAATGDAVNFPINKRADASDFAVKTAESQALKRCAVNLGDQFGLSLYAKGSTNAVVGRTLITETPAADNAVDEHVTEVVPESESREIPPMVEGQPRARGDLPHNKNGSLSVSQMSDEERKLYLGRTKAETMEDNKGLREIERMDQTGKKAERLPGTPSDDPWLLPEPEQAAS